MTTHTRRQFFQNAIPVTLGTTIGLSNVSAMGNSASTSIEKKMKIVVVGAHPDDPETICGGLMAMYSGLGHEVVSVYLTRGEAGIEGKTPRRIRKNSNGAKH